MVGVGNDSYVYLMTAYEDLLYIFQLLCMPFASISDQLGKYHLSVFSFHFNVLLRKHSNCSCKMLLVITAWSRDKSP